VVIKPGAKMAAYHLALRQAETACRLTPPTDRRYWAYCNILSLAQFRLGRYPEARNTLEQELAGLPALGASAVGLGASSPIAVALISERTAALSYPINLATRAMVYHHLGEKTKAQVCLSQLSELVKQPQWHTIQDAQALLREAEALIEGKAPDPKK
jgi:hypothetical protein